MPSLRAAEIEVLDTLAPDEASVGAAGDAAAALAAVPDDEPLDLLTPNGQRLPLSSGVRHLLGAVLREAAQGRLVMVASAREREVSTGEAARLLGVSRPHVVHLTEIGVLEARVPTPRPDAAFGRSERRGGAHRRLRLSDVLAYKKQLATAAGVAAALEEDDEMLDWGQLDRDVPPDARP